ncbi:Biotin transport ATP-binding protein BioM [Dermatophilus congolensis]|uniref:Biotin transport ATP-binding protein BioM n=1 Tax=Dermatophilus congolensis TaxID=1863 RepID=A0AA46BNL2_9MICO|nr:Biotin transport ATP-binding protein BioM [Dermatophilus congolensis]
MGVSDGVFGKGWLGVIEFRGVSHSFGGREVLRGVDVSLGEKRVGVIGANGSGKSTFARMINGLVLPSVGQVVVDGVDVGVDAVAVRRRVGFVFPDPDSQIVMPTVGEDVAFSLRRRRLSRVERDAVVGEALSQIGLAGRGGHPAARLSSGQKQLLALAAVLVTEPSVLVCDEPTTLLDRRNARAVASRIESLSQQVVLVTHHLELLRGWDRVLVFDEGEVVFDGGADEAIAFYVELMDGVGSC